MQREGSDETTYAEAGQLVYDFDEGVVEFSGQATITEGGNQISSSYLVYNIKEQRINASSGGEGDPKVRITYTPGALGELPDEVPEGLLPDEISLEEALPADDEPPEEGDSG